MREKKQKEKRRRMIEIPFLCIKEQTLHYDFKLTYRIHTITYHHFFSLYIPYTTYRYFLLILFININNAKSNLYDFLLFNIIFYYHFILIVYVLRTLYRV